MYLLEIFYLVASVTFILGLKMMSNPKTARRGNLIAAAGMTLAIAGTILLKSTSETRPVIYILILQRWWWVPSSAGLRPSA
jgi:NAD(P) transhydrogenase subunit beta